MLTRAAATALVAAATGVAGGIATGTMVEAHHSLSSVYDSSRPVTIEGVVAQFQLINPHPFLLVDVTDASGVARQWRLEMDNLSELKAIGVSAGTLTPGDRVIVRGSPARANTPALYVLRLDRPADGFWYEQVGQSPKIRPAPW